MNKQTQYISRMLNECIPERLLPEYNGRFAEEMDLAVQLPLIFDRMLEIKQRGFVGDANHVNSYLAWVIGITDEPPDFSKPFDMFGKPKPIRKPLVEF